MATKKLFDLNNPDDILQIHQLLLDGCDLSDDKHFQEDDPGSPAPGPSNLVAEVPEEEFDTDAEEEIEEREENSDTSQSDSEASTDCDDTEPVFVCHRKKGKKVIDSITWKNTPFPSKKRGTHNLLKRLPGPIGQGKGTETFFESWACLFDDSMLEIIVSFTNQYIEVVQHNYSRPRDAKKTNKTEIKAFIGLLYIAGIHKSGKLNLADLWDSNGFGIEIFRLTMGINRFRFLLMAVRFDDRQTRAERKAQDRLAPIRDIFEKFVKNCQVCYHVGEDVTIDEKLEGFRGRCNFVQYIPSKPAKYGIKIFAAVDSGVFYTCNMEIYAGKQPEGPFQVSNKPVDVVQRMVTPLRNSGRNITADNWFSDTTLLHTLSRNYGLSYVGTLKKNKWQIPKEMKDLKNREAYSSIFAFSKNGTMVSYIPQNKKKKKNVLLISSMHTDGAIDEESGEKRKPEVITYYNHHKIGVDMVDKMSGAYNVQRGTRRWPMVVFYAILNVAGINSQVISLGNGQNVPTRRLFLRELGNELIRDQLIMRVQLSNLPRTMTSRLRELLPNDQIPPRASSNSAATDAGGRQRCGLCLENKTKRYTKYSCKECGQYLCLQHCAFSCADGCNVGVGNESDSE